MSEASPPLMSKTIGKEVFSKRIHFYLDQREKGKKNILHKSKGKVK